jgi:uncharacterized membrane protein YeaQ/YmgE (transglycosylase-associated protein family)
MGILLWIVLGAAGGSIARYVMPGPDPAGTGGAILLGIGGGLLGGLACTLATGASWDGIDPRSLLVAITGALFALIGYRSYAMRWSA